MMPPDEGWKFSLIMKVLGWGKTMKMRNILYRAETSVLRNWDRIIYNLSHVRSRNRQITG